MWTNGLGHESLSPGESWRVGTRSVGQFNLTTPLPQVTYGRTQNAAIQVKGLVVLPADSSFSSHEVSQIDDRKAGGFLCSQGSYWDNGERYPTKCIRYGHETRSASCRAVSCH